MELFDWLTATVAGKFVLTMLVSMIPIVELRGGLPFGVALGLPYELAFPAAVLGNIIPAPFIHPPDLCPDAPLHAPAERHGG